ncbi:hypothetical protein TVAG_364590 [Trichomonas vaginalis G3]|uniref:Zinc finger Sec23/Sec24-type domain-containing protein n=1 Tax=Trichomonas vaginalis (strain ATCC PRA-98 / G3) TaxID=412133 RepID=A2E9H0_TRIV3|nr:ER to Golgi vesicle-mediated transport [Trichomonas vaginalis G3]EAY10734.1 hypothetical protein TVAG_364590 [Trichomonas vaginalis G3]KAI5538627.1 ER to Golgi vesicle-mediated transport [Trichomonas vaginalis G3]|eukprot:XP_001322957.1 hypothetical protein [Trichomonas vaginalis G3]
MSNDGIKVIVHDDIYYSLHSDTLQRDFIRSASIHISKNPNLYSFESLPAFIHYRPLPPLYQFSSPIRINCTKGDVPRCQKCHCYLSPFVQINQQMHAWYCPICNTTNSTIHFTPLSDMNVNKFDREELHNLVYDIIPPRNQLLKNGEARCFLFIIQEDLLNFGSSSQNNLIQALESAVQNFKENDKIGLITFSSVVTLYNLVSLKAMSYSEFDTELVTDPLTLVNAREFSQNFISCVKSRSKLDKISSPRLFTALQWAQNYLKGLGGRILLFTSGKFDEKNLDLISDFKSESISLSVFAQTPNSHLDSLALATGGYSTHIFDDSLLSSLFGVETGWDSSTVFRYDSRVAKIGPILSGFSNNSEEVLKHPVIDETMSITVPLSIIPGSSGVFTFQFATRFTTDLGERLIRVVNGQMPISDFCPMPYDTSAIALYILRLNAMNILKDQISFTKSMQDLKKSITLKDLPLLIYTGNMREKSMLMSCSVERFGFSVLVTVFVVNEVNYYVLWTPKKVVVYPKPSDQEIKLIQQISRQKGLIMTSIYSPETVEEFQSISRTEQEAFDWFQRL